MKVVNKYKEPFDVYIGRGSKWGNPFKIGHEGASRAEVIQMYEVYMRGSSLRDQLYELDDKVLGCFCKPLACHGDVLVKLRKEQIDEGLFINTAWRPQDEEEEI